MNTQKRSLLAALADWIAGLFLDILNDKITPKAKLAFGVICIFMQKYLAECKNLCIFAR